MQKLSVVIITHNEEHNIGRCITSLGNVADDIVIVDSGSTDKTESICNENSLVRFFHQDWQGYSTQKNYANTLAKYDMILSLDADEALSDELRNALIALKNISTVIPIASFNRRSNYCGKWIHHCGWYPDNKVRVFDRTKHHWEGHIHEKIVKKQETREKNQEARSKSQEPEGNNSQLRTPNSQFLKGDCLHYTYYTIEEHYKQAEKFAQLSAEDLFKKGKRSNWIKIYMKTVFKFFRNYILKLGVLDGQYGFTICKIIAWETYKKYSLLRTKQKTNG